MSLRKKTRQIKHLKLGLSSLSGSSSPLATVSDTTMIQLNSSEHSLNVRPFATMRPVTSGVSPWLTALTYPLGRFLVLPSYFGRLEVS
ncbi:MAG TPA: hypothetical protein VIQ31_03165, partial [Phormidium sp.]